MKSIFTFILVLCAASVFGQDWQPGAGGRVPPMSTPAGYEADGSPLYIIRASFSGGLHPGKANPAHTRGYVSWGGKENPVASYEVYSGAGRWVRGNVQNVPEGAVIGGREADGTPLYIIRAPQEGGLHPGKFNSKYKTAYIPYRGAEIELREFEILVADWLPLRGMTVPANAFQTGAAATASPYIIRAKQGSGLHPGKLSPAGGKGYISYGGREIELRSGMEVFVGSGVWVKPGETGLPFGAIKAGYGDDGKPLYIARAPLNRGIHAGKVGLESRQAWVPYGGREVLVDDYEVLVYDFQGRIREPAPVAVTQMNRPEPQISVQPAPPPAASPRPAGNLRVSSRGDRPVEMLVINETSRPVQLVWLDYTGRQVPYFTIEPGKTYLQKSFETHVWLLTYSAGNWNSYGYFVLGPEERQELLVEYTGGS